YPLMGNYGVPGEFAHSEFSTAFESERIQVAGLIVAEVSRQPHHWNAAMSLPRWLAEQRVPALSGVDVRALTKHLRERGTLLGTLCVEEERIEFRDPNTENLVSQVSVKEPRIYPGGKKRVVVVDCGCKNSIIRGLVARGVSVMRVPWDYNFLSEK